MYVVILILTMKDLLYNPNSPKSIVADTSNAYGGGIHLEDTRAQFEYCMFKKNMGMNSNVWLYSI